MVDAAEKGFGAHQNEFIIHHYGISSISHIPDMPLIRRSAGSSTGSRSMSNLSAATRLERKRTDNRNTQRVYRKRTKEKIEQNRERCRELKERNRALEERNRELEAELRLLRAAKSAVDNNISLGMSMTLDQNMSADIANPIGNIDKGGDDAFSLYTNDFNNSFDEGLRMVGQRHKYHQNVFHFRIPEIEEERDSYVAGFRRREEKLKDILAKKC